jgi:hypothetical protein
VDDERSAAPFAVQRERKLGSAGWGNLVLLFQGVWRNEAGTWRLVNLQTALPPPPAPKP